MQQQGSSVMCVLQDLMGYLCVYTFGMKFPLAKDQVLLAFSGATIRTGCNYIVLSELQTFSITLSKIELIHHAKCYPLYYPWQTKVPTYQGTIHSTDACPCSSLPLD